jgi:hypothetical protein
LVSGWPVGFCRLKPPGGLLPAAALPGSGVSGASLSTLPSLLPRARPE